MNSETLLGPAVVIRSFDVEGSMGFDRRGDLDVGHVLCALESVTSMPGNDGFPDGVELAQM